MHKRVTLVLVVLCSLALSMVMGCVGLIIQNPNPNLQPHQAITDIPRTPISTPLNFLPLHISPTPVLTSSRISGWVVYSLWVSQNPVESQIFLQNLETGEITQLTHLGNNSSPVWSSDGSQIMFLSWTRENSFDIYIMDRDGKNQRSIIADPASEIMPDWSLEGDKVVYISNKDGNNEIYVLDLISKNTNQLTKSQKMKASPKWSPDGEKIAFVSNTGTSGRSQIFIMNADGTDVKPVTEFDLYYDDSPVWCPDSTCIIFTRLENGPKLMIFDLINKKATALLANLFDHEPRLSEAGISRSPSRGYITFYVDEMFYAMDMKSRGIYPLDIKAKDLSLYP